MTTDFKPDIKEQKFGKDSRNLPATLPITLKDLFAYDLELATTNTNSVAKLSIYLNNGLRLKGDYINNNNHWITIAQETGAEPLQVMWSQVASFIIY